MANLAYLDILTDSVISLTMSHHKTVAILASCHIKGTATIKIHSLHITYLKKLEEERYGYQLYSTICD